MQSLFRREDDWHAPWMARVLPVVERIAGALPERTVFTRFIPPRGPEEGGGTWRRYYDRWRSMTLAALPPEQIDLVPNWPASCRRPR